jgi:hypothetical protein
MKVIVRDGLYNKTTSVNCSLWGVDTEGWLVFRDENNEVCRVMKSWDSIEVVEDSPSRCPDDVLDQQDIRRGYCDI